MPTYRYRCGTCGEEFEVWQSMTDPALAIHREAVLGEGSVPDSECDGTLVKVLSPAGIVLKGSGFYKNDSRSSNGSRGGGSRPDKRDDKRDKDSSSSSSDSSSSSSDSSSSSSDSKKSDTGSKTSDSKKSDTKKSDSSSTPSSSTSSKK